MRRLLLRLKTTQRQQQCGALAHLSDAPRCRRTAHRHWRPQALRRRVYDPAPCARRRLCLQDVHQRTIARHKHHLNTTLSRPRHDGNPSKATGGSALSTHNTTPRCTAGWCPAKGDSANSPQRRQQRHTRPDRTSALVCGRTAAAWTAGAFTAAHVHTRTREHVQDTIAVHATNATSRFRDRHPSSTACARTS